LQDSYEFEYDCESEAYGEHGMQTDYTTIGISVVLENEKPRMYAVDICLRDTPNNDLQSVEYDMFLQVEHKMLAELAADGVTRSMLIYP
jgi:hypothetical protein